MRYSDSELSVIKTTFVENDELLKAIRKFFLQLDMTVAEKGMIKEIKNKPELLAVLRKSFLPTIDGDAPFQQVVDLFMTLKIDDKDPEQALVHIMSRKLLIDYLEQQLRELETGKSIGGIIFEDLTSFDKKDTTESYVNLLTRNTIIGHTEMQLNQFIVLAGQTDETVEQTKDRLFKNSAK